LGIKSFFTSCLRLVKLIGKPELKEMSTSVKTTLIGLAILGVLGFIIKILATMFQAIPPTT